MIYIGHVISLLIYIATFATCIYSLVCCVKPAKLYGSIKYIVPSFLVSLSIQSFLFIALQIDWIVHDYNELIGNVDAFAWLAFDYFNGFALLTFATTLRIWLGWRLDEYSTPASRSMHGRDKMIEKSCDTCDK